MLRSLAVALAAMVGLSLASQPALAQQDVLTDLYGSAVHCYFAGKPAEAHERLTKVIDAGYQDPRAFYFRGLAFMQLGRPQQAEADFQRGAELEAADVNNLFPVARSLERVQGSVRISIDNFRTEAALVAQVRAGNINKERYGEPRAAEPDAPPATGVAPPPVDAPAVPPAVPPAPAKEPADDLFGAAPKAPEAAPAQKPADDGFGGGDVFGGAPAAPKAEPAKADDVFGAPAEEKKAPADEFGAPAPAPAPAPGGGADDVFGGGAPGAAPIAEDPAKPPVAIPDQPVFDPLAPAPGPAPAPAPPAPAPAPPANDFGAPAAPPAAPPAAAPGAAGNAKAPPAAVGGAVLGGLKAAIIGGDKNKDAKGPNVNVPAAAPVADDAFGAEPAPKEAAPPAVEEKAPAKEPASDKAAPPEDGDPFDDEPAAKAPAKEEAAPAEKKKADDAETPFGE